MKSMALSALLLAFALTRVSEAQERPYLEAARSAARWLRATALETEHGVTWPVVPAESARSSTDLYSGSPGVVLFLLELSAATEEDEPLALARAGADELVATLPAAIGPEGAGLYTGVAGVGFVLAETWRATGEASYRAAALRCVELVRAAAVETGHGVRWTETTDVISGAAGTGLFLLYSAEVLERPQDVELAARAGRHLVAIAEKSESGWAWSMDPSYPRRMPNFSHGTAGVAYFLACLHGATGGLDVLEAALGGARRLESLADPQCAGLRVHHHAPGGEELYYLGWCHGPVGTARLFARLDQLADERGWDERVRRCALALTSSGIPEARPEGFWNNVGQCCGSAGVAEFMLDVGELDFAKKVADDVLARGTREDGMLSWVQAEHRVRPELLQAQTGTMQGAAGIGMMLLHLDAAEHDPRARIRLPDDPY